jgi:general secretion pathway protein L
LPEAAIVRIDLRADVTWADFTRGVRAFGRWWVSEILAMLPEAWRSQIGGWISRPHMRLSNSQWVVSWPGSDIASISVDASLPDSAIGASLATQAADRLTKPVCFDLPGREVLRRNIRLPVAATARLRSAVELQLERISPFRSEDVAFDCSVPPSVPQDGEVDVDVAIVPLATLLRYADWLKGLGLRAAEFRAEGGDHRFGGVSFDWRWNRGTQRWALVGAGLLCWGAAYLLAPSLRESEFDSTTTQVSALRIVSSDAAQAKDTLDGLATPAAFLAQKERAPSPLDALKALTLGIPDNTRLISLVIEGERVRAAGITRDALLLMRVLAKSNRFSDLRWSGPIEPIQGGGSRFTLELTLRLSTGGGTLL